MLETVLEKIAPNINNRVPVIRQAEIAECGLACLAMVAHHFGFETDITSLRHRTSISLEGLKLKNLISIAHSIGLDSRAVKLELDELNQLQLPTILHWDLNHFVVLVRVQGDQFIINDPAIGQRTYKIDTLSKHFTGVALELFPNEGFEKKREKHDLRFSDLWTKVTGLKNALWRIFLLTLVLQFFTLIAPFYLQLTIDEVLVKSDHSLMSVLALSFIGFLFLQVTAQAARNFILLHIGSLFSFQLISNLFEHLQRLPLPFFEKRHIGDVLSRFASTAPLQQALTEELIAAVIDGLMTTLTLLLMFLYSPLLAFTSLAFWMTYLVIRLVSYYKLKQLNEENIIAEAHEQTVFIENIRGIQSIKVFGKELDRKTLWQNKFATAVNSGIKLEQLNIWYNIAHTLVFGIGYILIILLAAQMVMENTFTVGMLFAFMAYEGLFKERASTLVDYAISFRMLDIHLNRLADITSTKQDHLSKDKDLQNNSSITGQVRVEQIKFRYSDAHPPILDSLSLYINAGETVAIVGASGSGKTTLLKVLLGLLEPSEGSVLYDENNIRKINSSFLRSNVATVMQEDSLFSGSIAENISFFDPSADIDQIMACAKLTYIHQEICSMPMGYETLVGDMGSTLSSGQKQRLLLARALYSRPKVLFIDEGSAHLDLETEALVNKSISDLDITRVMIAHRPQTIKFADRVYQLVDGKCSEIDKNVY